MVGQPASGNIIVKDVSKSGQESQRQSWSCSNNKTNVLICQTITGESAMQALVRGLDSMYSYCRVEFIGNLTPVLNSIQSSLGKVRIAN